MQHLQQLPVKRGQIFKAKDLLCKQNFQQIEVIIVRNWPLFYVILIFLKSISELQIIKAWKLVLNGLLLIKIELYAKCFHKEKASI